MEIPVDSLRKLPDGAVYTAQSGQANIKVSRKPGKDGKAATVYVYATCDSLELQCETYEKTVKSFSTQLTALRQQRDTISKNPHNAFITALKWLSLGFAIGVMATLITIVFIIKKKKK